MSDDVTITVRVGDRTAAGFRDINGRLRTLDGRFAATAASMNRSSNKAKVSFDDLKSTLLSLAPAAVPVAAALAPIAVHAGAAGLAVAAFGAAVVPQIANLKDAASAQDKYTAAVTKYGAGSKQAVAAQQFVADTLSSMPKATQRASAAFSNLHDTFKNFSDNSAKFTMAPVEHSFAVLGAIIPKLTPMAQGAAGQLDRLVKVAGGAVNTAGFDSLSKKVGDFADSSLKKAVDGTIHFARVLSEGNMSGPIAQFFAYAKAQGPAVKELFTNLAKAVSNLLQGAAEAGPGLLTLVNGFAKLVAAVPASLVGTLMSVYSAFKLIKLAGVGIGAAAGGIQSLATKVAALQAASAAAGGGVAGLKAAFLSLGTAAKATVVIAGITILAVALSKLSNIGKKAPPDVDRMATSIANLGRTGKVSGEALRSYGKDLGGLADSLRTLSRPSNLDKTQQFLTSLIGMDSTPVAKAKEDLDAVDKSLAGLVKGGKADLAKAAFDDIAKSMEKQGLSSKELKGKLDDYKGALADQALEAKLTAESQGLFGQAAQDTSAKLDAQKASADGLRQSIQALNDVNRQGLGGMIGFEAAIDAAADAAKKNAGALRMNHGVLDLNSQKARDAATALQDLADKTDSAAAAARESNASWETVNGIYARGRSQLIKSAQAMGLTRSQAAALANQILKIPDKTARVKGNIEDLQAKIAAAKARLKSVPDSRKAKVRAEISDLEAKLRQARADLAGINGQTATVRILTQYFTAKSPAQLAAAHGRASGGMIRGYADGGTPGGRVSGPGTGTSDSIPAMLSNGEYVVKAASVAKYGERFMDAVNSGSLRVSGYAKGGVTKAERQARHDAAGLLTISHFGQMSGYQRSEFGSALGKPGSLSDLVNSLNQWAGIIKAATHGGQEKSLLKALDSSGKKLLSWEKQLTKVSASLETAKAKLDSLKQAASQLADSVKSGILSSANIVKSGGEGGPVTVSSIMGGLTQSRDQATAFAGALKDLKKKGLSSALIQQIAEAGIGGGGLETAGALLGASSSEIASINSLQGQINKAAGSAGKTTADSVYGAAIKAQTTVVNRLTQSQDRLKASMDKLAKSMEKLVEKAFGKKASGGIVGAAASGGLRGGLTWVGEHEPELLDLPVGSRVWSGPDSRRKAREAQAPWASMLNTPRRHGAPAVGAAGRPEPVVIELRSSGSEVDEFLLKILRRAINVRGGNAQVVLTGRK